MVAPHTGPNGHPGGPESATGPTGSERLHRPATGPHPLEPLMAHLMELRRHAGHYVQAVADSFRLTLRQAAVRAVLGCLGAVVGVAVLVTSTVMLLDGIAGGIAVALGGRVWAGQLITGAVVLSGIALACWWFIGRMTESSRRKTIEKYERQHHQRASGRSTDEPGRHEQPV